MENQTQHQGPESLLVNLAKHEAGENERLGKIYAKASDSKLYFKNDSGTEYDLTAGNDSPTPAGSNNHVQYNEGGTLAGSARFQFFHGATDKNFLMRTQFFDGLVYILFL